MSRSSIDRAQARRIALGAQGFGRRPTAPPSRRALLILIGNLGVVQIDSVNVLVRSHYLPAFSRLGAYDRRQLEDAAYGPDRRLFEYWAHEASFVPLPLQPLFRWRMARAREGRDTYAGLARFGRENRALIARTLAEVRERGPLRAADVSDHRPTGEAWWGWSPVKSALEWSFWTGDLMTAQRRNFERVYDLAERVLPPAIIAAPTPSPEEAQRALLRIAARALGIATASDLRDYFRLPVADTRARIAELVEDGDLEPVTVEGWKQDAYLAAGARIPRTIDACALLSPFDSLIWERARTERLFDFVYRLEIYTPKHKRRHGYYVLPFLFGDRLAARADCKADRAEGKLRVLAVHYEDARPSAALRAALADELAQLAAWLDLAPPPRRLPVLSQ